MEFVLLACQLLVLGSVTEARLVGGVRLSGDNSTTPVDECIDFHQKPPGLRANVDYHTESPPAVAIVHANYANKHSQTPFLSTSKGNCGISQPIVPARSEAESPYCEVPWLPPPRPGSNRASYCATFLFWFFANPEPLKDALACQANDKTCGYDVQSIQTYTKQTTKTKSFTFSSGYQWKVGVGWDAAFMGKPVHLSFEFTHTLTTAWSRTESHTEGWMNASGIITHGSRPDDSVGSCGSFWAAPQYLGQCGHINGTLYREEETFMCGNNNVRVKTRTGEETSRFEPIFVAEDCKSREFLGPQCQTETWNQVIVWSDWTEWIKSRPKDLVGVPKYHADDELKSHYGEWRAYGHEKDPDYKAIMASITRGGS